MIIGFDLGHDHDLEFSRSDIEYIAGKNYSDCHETKSKINYWLNSRPSCDHQVLPWPWPWPSRFQIQGQIWNLVYLSQRLFDWRLPQKEKQTYQLNSSNVTIRFYLEHDLERWGDRGDFRCWHAVDSSSFVKQCIEMKFINHLKS